MEFNSWTCGHKLSTPEEGVEPFMMKLKDLMEEMDLHTTQGYTADVTGLYWRCLPDKTLDGASEKEVLGHKKQHDRVTHVACANAEDTHMIPILVIYKFPQPRYLNGVSRDRLPCSYTTNQQNARMNSAFLI